MKELKLNLNKGVYVIVRKAKNGYGVGCDFVYITQSYVDAVKHKESLKINDNINTYDVAEFHDVFRIGTGK